MKHFKKSMIVEYERIESNGGIDDSSSHSTASTSSASSSSSSSSSASSRSSANSSNSFHSATSFANTVISKATLENHHDNQRPNENDKENEEKNAKKRKRKSLDESGSAAKTPNVSLSTIVAAAAAVAATSSTSHDFQHSDLYEDESGDSGDRRPAADPAKIDASSKKSSSAKPVKSVKRELNDFSGEFSDSNTRSDYDLPQSSSFHATDNERSELKEVKRKKTNDFGAELSSSSSFSSKKANKLDAEKKEHKSGGSSVAEKASKPKNTADTSMEGSSSKNKVKKHDKSGKVVEKSVEEKTASSGHHAGSSKQEVYCICKSADSTRFMM